MMAALRRHAPCAEITYETGDGWKACDRLSQDGTVRTFYEYEDGPTALFPLKIEIFSLGRTCTVTIKSAEEICNA
jgi:hypothetical protein